MVDSSGGQGWATPWPRERTDSLPTGGSEPQLQNKRLELVPS